MSEQPMRIELIALGASLGGLDAVSTVLAALPGGSRAAVAVVQHRRVDPRSRLAQILNRQCRLQVREPDDGDPIEPGVVYLAPADYHMPIDGRAVSLSVDEPECFARPSVDVLFETAADAYGCRLAAVQLTGSSADGARGMAAVRRAGGMTIVQHPADAESPVAPRAALEATAVDHVLELVGSPSCWLGSAVPRGSAEPSRSSGWPRASR